VTAYCLAHVVDVLRHILILIIVVLCHIHSKISAQMIGSDRIFTHALLNLKIKNAKLLICNVYVEIRGLMRLCR